MGRYGIGIYGTDTYGLPLVSEFATDVTIEPRGYDKLRLSWSPPGGEWSDVRLVRSSYGFPLSINKGTTLFEETEANSPLSYLDGDTPPNSPGSLHPGRFYYYTLFVYSTDRLEWVPSGFAFGVVTVDFDFGAMLYERLPAIYKERDLSTTAQPLGPLQRFCNLFGYEVDRLRTEAETLLDVANIDLVSGGLLPTLADSLGITYEPELGMQISRVIIDNSVHLSKIKGTRTGIEGIASAYTGFGVTAVIGSNLLLDTTDSGWVVDGANLLDHVDRSFETGVGSWAADTNCTVARVADADAPDGESVLELTATGAGDMAARTATGTSGVGVEAGTFYTAEIHTKADATIRTVTVGIEWYDGTGASLSTDTSAGETNTTGGYAHTSVNAQAPTGAEYASIVVTVTGAAGAEVHYLDQVGLHPAEVGHWTVVQNCFLDRYTADAFTPAAGTGTLRVIGDSGGTDAVVASGQHSGRTLLAVEPSTDYVASVYAQHEGTPANVSVEIEFFDIDGASLGTTGSTPTADTGAWVRHEVTATSGASAVWAAMRLRVTTPADGESHLFSGAQFEAGAVASTWEDGRKIHVYLEPERQNLVANPSFETGTSGWAARTNCTIAQSAVEAASGVNSLLLSSTAAGDMAAQTDTGTSGFPVTEAEVYTVQAAFRAASVARTCRVTISWYDGAGALLSESIDATTDTANATGDWTVASMTATAPANAEYAAVTAEVQATGGAAEDHYVDAVMLEESEFLKSYFDASLTPEANYLWEGTAHASVSDLYTRRVLKDNRLQDVLAKAIPVGSAVETHYGETAPASAV